MSEEPSNTSMSTAPEDDEIKIFFEQISEVFEEVGPYVVKNHDLWEKVERAKNIFSSMSVKRLHMVMGTRLDELMGRGQTPHDTSNSQSQKEEDSQLTMMFMKELAAAAEKSGKGEIRQNGSYFEFIPRNKKAEK
jgi:hypothetical protein